MRQKAEFGDEKRKKTRYAYNKVEFPEKRKTVACKSPIKSIIVIKYRHGGTHVFM